MDSNLAAENLQTIRTLMERSALYRRALAPIMIYAGALGSVGALAGRWLQIESSRSFILYWASVAAVALLGSLLLVRRQALKDAEPFWSPPTRRVTQAFLPALVAGLLISAATLARAGSNHLDIDSAGTIRWLPLAWVILYGCGLHAAGLFMPRGMKLFGWALILGACAVFAAGMPGDLRRLDYAHGIMGCFFGALHLAYGIYLYLTESRRNET